MLNLCDILQDLEKKYKEIVSTYRSHLLASIQVKIIYKELTFSHSLASLFLYKLFNQFILYCYAEMVTKCKSLHSKAASLVIFLFIAQGSLFVEECSSISIALGQSLLGCLCSRMLQTDFSFSWLTNTYDLNSDLNSAQVNYMCLNQEIY